MKTFLRLVVFTLCFCSVSHFQAQTTLIDFEGLGYVDNTSAGSTFDIGNFRFTYSEGDMFEDTNDGKDGSAGIITTQFSGSAETLTIESIDGSTYDFQNFYLNEFGAAPFFNSGVASVEGFKNNVSTGTEGPFATTTTHLLNSNLDDVDKVVLTSQGGGFFVLFDEFEFVSNSSSGSTLTIGDIALTGMNTDDEKFSFVTLVDLDAGTEIYFTDEEPSGSNVNPATAEGIIKYTAPTAIAAGSVITYDNSAGGAFTGTGFALLQGNMVLSNGGEGVTAFVDYNTTTGEVGTFLHSIGEDAGDVGTPNGLMSGDGIVIYGADNGQYNGTRTGSKENLWTAINTVSNWTTSSDFSGVTLNATSFTLSSCALTGSVTAQTNVACNGASTGSLTVTANNGTANYDFEWRKDGSLFTGLYNTNSNSHTLNAIPAGDYEITITDGNDCTTIVNATITQPSTALSASGVATNVSCNGGNDGALDLTVTGGTPPYTFAWSNTATTEDLSGLEANTYNVTVTDAKGCTATESVEVLQPAVLLANGVATNVSCNGGNDGAVDLTVIGGNPPYTFAWSNTATTEDLSGLEANTYNVTVTDAKGCTATESVEVLQPAVLSANGVATNVSCNGGNDGAVDLTVVGGTPPYTFAWNNTATTEDLSGLTAATYSVTVTDSKGCTATESVDVFEPIILEANGVATNVSCNGGNDGAVDLTVIGGNPPYTFAWSNTATTEDLSGLEANTYNVTVTDSKGCTATASATVEVNDTEAPTITCPSDIVTGNDPGSLDAVVSYTVTASDNCSGTSISQTAGLASGSTFPIGITTNTFLATDAAGNTETCSFTVTVNPDGYVYQDNTWYPTVPEGNALSSDNLYVVNGTTNLTADLEVNNVEVMSGANLDIENVLKVNGDFENNGTVTFKSTATKDGELDEFTGNITGTGSFVVERFNVDQRSYRMLTSSVNSNESIQANWQEGADSSTDNPNPGFGTHITGSTIDQQNGFDGTATGNASMYLINSQTQDFEAIANTDNTNLVAGQPYFMYIRGDRSIDLTATTANQGSTSTILRATGMLATGNQQQQFTINNDGDYLMFGNPYQSSIDMTGVTSNSNNVNGSFYYVYDPNVGTLGGYVTVDLSNNSNNSPDSNASQYLQPGQGAQIAGNTSGTVTLNFAEADKAPGNHSNTSKMNTNFAGIKAGLYTTENFQNGNRSHDGFVISFDGSNQLTQEDATKPMNIGENLGISKEGKTFSIEKREMPQATDVIQLFTNNYNGQEYTLTLEVTGLIGVTAYFNDNYTGTSMQLNEGMNTISILVDQSIEASMASNRFHIGFASESLGTKEDSYFSLSLYPNPTRDGNFSIISTELSDQKVSLTVTDLLGREVINQHARFSGNSLKVDASEKLTSGVYLINITKGNRTQTVKLIKE